MNVNIQINSNLAEKLSTIASAKGITLSEEIEYRLLLVPINIGEKPSSNISKKLRGIVTLPKDFDYKKELQKREL